MRAFLTAVQFLTRVPVPGGDRPATPDVLTRSARYFPLVGLLIGLTTGAVLLGAARLWPPLVAALLALIVEARLTGGFHEDAVADTFDAFGGGWTTDDVLRILKDSRLGAYGAIALILGIALRAALFVALLERADPWTTLAAVAASAAYGRWGILILMVRLPPPDGRISLARDIGQQLGVGSVLIGLVGALPALAALAWLRPLHALMAVALCALLWLWSLGYFRRRIGGVTGDGLGAVCYGGQLAVLLAASAQLG
ncbi:MAG: adenosylcobinamide-GDP ribazoletransferase [Acidobacteriota bacterium]